MVCAPILDDLWDAVTNPERLPRWCSSVSGDFELGGRYSIEGKAFMRWESGSGRDVRDRLSGCRFPEVARALPSEGRGT